VTVTEPGCAMLVLGRQVDGAWALSDGAGHVIGVFPSHEAARLHAESEQVGQADVAIATSAGTRAVCKVADAR
jgi:hypothetical protein